MKNTTLCYIEKDQKYLMLYRNKKEKDENQGKWIGVGGKFEEGESPEQCLCREVYEETGLILTSYRWRGIVTFVSDEWGTEYMFLYTADGFKGELPEADERGRIPCAEGELMWIPKEQVKNLNLWEGDRVFLKKLLEKDAMFSLRLQYKGEELVEVSEAVFQVYS